MSDGPAPGRPPNPSTLPGTAAVATGPVAEGKAPGGVPAPPGAPIRRLEWLRRAGHQRHAEGLRRARRQIIGAIVLLVGVGGVLTALGLSQVRGSTAGRYVDPTLQPDDPGYAAYVTPTPTMLVVSATADGRLGGVALLALQGEDAGGSVVVIPTTTTTTGTELGGTTLSLADGYRRSGAQGVTSLVEQVLKLAVGETVEIDDQRWATLVQPVGGVSIRLDVPVGDWPEGRVSLEPGEVGPFLATLAPEESELNRATRQEDFWRAWLEEVARGGDDAVAGERDSGLGRFVGGLATGPDVDSLPVVAVAGADREEHVLDAALAATELARAIPFPQSPAPGVRPRVRLLNGTGDPSLTAQAAELLVTAGAEITISGNADSFDEPATRIIYGDPDLQSMVTWIQAILGIGELEHDSSGQDAAVVDEPDQIDVTVILGADAPEAIRR